MAGLGDVLAGAAGVPVNRQGLESFVANSQANNGLRTAQTDQAIGNAINMRDENVARAGLEDAFAAIGHSPAEAKALATFQTAQHDGSAKSALEALNESLAVQNRQKLSNPALLGTADQTAAQQGLENKVATPVAVPDTYMTLPGAAAPNPQQTAHGAAATGALASLGDLHQTQADAGGFRPALGINDLSPELRQAVYENRLDPSRINSRTVSIFDALAKNNPSYNFNRAIADAALSKNATFQQKAMVAEGLPGNISHMVDLGNGLDYPDLAVVGKIQQYMNQQLNDPKLAEYLAVRNDTILKIAGVMRSVGMSDKTTALEDEIQHPTMSPAAIKGWAKGQMSALQPLLDQQRRASHIGEQGGTAGDGRAPSAPSVNQGGGLPIFQPGGAAAPAGGAADPLGIR